ncbi:chitinase [Mucilaginibacter daejeonensis]|uniref:chitinase n=1 Tax=Mucilaginibacter daejeonensis TaxID=398049 RepID=UPI001D1730F3|nr:chitinase [Mucilaginibacter daejeonensis]UEG54568.1 chitinase [Mucilaginibacter daejeonensis]
MRPAADASSLIGEKQFNELFPQRQKFYTYQSFVRAIKELGDIKIRVARRATSVYQITRTDKRTGQSKVVRQDVDWNESWAKVKPDSVYEVDFGKFCAEKDPATNKKELAAFFANIAHETRGGEDDTFTDGLMYIHEKDTTNAYVAENDEYPPVPGKKYYGRGPVQLSYNGNYGYAGDVILGDHNILLKNPDLIQTDAVLAFKTAIYFWMTPQTHKPSAHDVMIGVWQPKPKDKAKGRAPGFGMTINIVNGEVECNKGENNYSMKDRMKFYQYFLGKLGVKDTTNCSCATMQP